MPRKSKPRKNPLAVGLGKLRAKRGDMAAIGALGGIAARGRSGRPGVPTQCPVCHAEQPSKRAAMAHCPKEAK